MSLLEHFSMRNTVKDGERSLIEELFFVKRHLFEGVK